jgi:hypothetical protein
MWDKALPSTGDLVSNVFGNIFLVEIHQNYDDSSVAELTYSTN